MVQTADMRCVLPSLASWQRVQHAVQAGARPEVFCSLGSGLAGMAPCCHHTDAWGLQGAAAVPGWRQLLHIPAPRRTHQVSTCLSSCCSALAPTFSSALTGSSSWRHACLHNLVQQTLNDHTWPWRGSYLSPCPSALPASGFQQSMRNVPPAAGPGSSTASRSPTRPSLPPGPGVQRPARSLQPRPRLQQLPPAGPELPLVQLLPSLAPRGVARRQQPVPLPHHLHLRLKKPAPLHLTALKPPLPLSPNPQRLQMLLPQPPWRPLVIGRLQLIPRSRLPPACLPPLLSREDACIRRRQAWLSENHQPAHPLHWKMSQIRAGPRSALGSCLQPHQTLQMRASRWPCRPSSPQASGLHPARMPPLRTWKGVTSRSSQLRVLPPSLRHQPIKQLGD